MLSGFTVQGKRERPEQLGEFARGPAAAGGPSEKIDPARGEKPSARARSSRLRAWIVGVPSASRSTVTASVRPWQRPGAVERRQARPHQQPTRHRGEQDKEHQHGEQPEQDANGVETGTRHRDGSERKKRSAKRRKCSSSRSRPPREPTPPAGKPPADARGSFPGKMLQRALAAPPAASARETLDCHINV